MLLKGLSKFIVFFLTLKKGLETCFNPFWVGDGYCDDTANIPECNYDGGDCCGTNAITHYCSACECLTDGSKDGNEEENETSSEVENSGIDIRWNFYSNVQLASP